ncbi:class I SAM-dependent methyltransferase [Minwuia sp.]|uniref:class I SAM-dependent methyltransferase n=1 Tax=Minwuia sp. TaxID=2493630 RepID=UPI003A8DD751
MGERTLSGAAREGWFIPYRYAGDVDEQTSYRRMQTEFGQLHDRFSDVLTLTGQCRNDLLAIGLNDPAPAPRWDQDWFAGLDAAVAYAMVRHHQPKRIVEVGSGHSTRFMVRAIADGHLSCRFTAIDPAPRADISTLPVEVIADVVQRADPKVFEDLASGDMLFIDSSHILMPGTDVDLLFGEIIPCLPPGVIVHVHDIFLPFPYPPEWQPRGYNEQNALAPMIAGGVLAPLFPCQYVRREMHAEVERLAGFLPRPRPNHDASFWTVRS